jgi:hypothetical protein
MSAELTPVQESLARQMREPGRAVPEPSRESQASMPR